MKLLSILILSALITACGGPRYALIPPEEQGHTVVIELPNETKETLFNRATEWVAIKYVSGKDVIQEKNPETGRIIGRGVTTIVVDSGGLMDAYDQYSYSIIIDVKDNKARIQLGGYAHATYSTNPTYAMHVLPLNESMKEIAADLEAYLKTGGTGSMAGGSDSW